MPRSLPGLPRDWISAYLLATPGFLLADFAFDANVRVVGLAGVPELRWAYYLLVSGAGVLVHVRPWWSAPVGLVESSANLLILILSFFLPYFALADQILDGTVSPATAGSFGLEWVANFMLAGSCAVFSFHRSAGTFRPA